MELRQIEYFLAVSKTKSLTQAAKELYVSQPAITSAINNLEQELGVQLFMRTKRLVELTDEGETFQAHASIVIADINKTITQMTQVKEKKQGRIRIAANPLLAKCFLLPAFQIYNPKNITIIVGEHRELFDLIRNGECDIILTLGNDSEYIEFVNKVCLYQGTINSFQERKMDSALNGEVVIVTGAYHHDYVKSVMSLVNVNSEYIRIFHSDQSDIIDYLMKQQNAKSYLPDFYLRGVGERLNPNIPCNIYMISRVSLDSYEHHFIFDLGNFIKEGR